MKSNILQFPKTAKAVVEKVLPSTPEGWKAALISAAEAVGQAAASADSEAMRSAHATLEEIKQKMPEEVKKKLADDASVKPADWTNLMRAGWELVKAVLEIRAKLR